MSVQYLIGIKKKGKDGNNQRTRLREVTFYLRLYGLAEIKQVHLYV